VPASVPFVIDVLPPTVLVTRTQTGANVTAWDLVSDDSALLARLRTTDMKRQHRRLVVVGHSDEFERQAQRARRRERRRGRGEGRDRERRSEYCVDSRSTRSDARAAGAGCSCSLQDAESGVGGPGLAIALGLGIAVLGAARRGPFGALGCRALLVTVAWPRARSWARSPLAQA